MQKLMLLTLFIFSKISFSQEYIIIPKDKHSLNLILKLKEIKYLKNFGPKNRFILINSDKNEYQIKEFFRINGLKVKSISKNDTIRLPNITNPKTKNVFLSKSKLWWQDHLMLEQAHEITRGKENIIVAVIDTGVDYLHKDLRDNIFRNEKEIPNNGIDDDNNGRIDDYYGFNFFSNLGSGMDDNGHGTHCAGIIASNGELKGIAPEVKILPLKFLNNYGQGDIAKAIDAITYAVDAGAKIISNSYGNPNSNAAFLEVLEYARRQNVLFFAAAGNAKNDNDMRGEYPANYHLENVISVAAVKANLSKAAYSNHGQLSVDVFAPGDQIFSLDMNNEYKVRSGTSMATPMAAGVAALLIAHNPNLTVNDITKRIKETSLKLSELYGLAQSPGVVLAHGALLNNVKPIEYPFPRSKIKDETFNLKSDSPYENNTNKAYQLGFTNASQMALNFELIDIENGYDYLQIENANGKILKKLTGKIKKGVTKFYPYDKLILRIISDNSETRQGFEITSINYLP